MRPQLAPVGRDQAGIALRGFADLADASYNLSSAIIISGVP
jgi:hypothetical protein